MCAQYWNEGPGNFTLEAAAPVWPSKEACCQAGGGAYEKGASPSSPSDLLCWRPRGM